jgi:hypothetical protein
MNTNTPCIRGRGRTDTNGYTRQRHPITRRQDYQHRVSFELAHGPIPDGYVVHHMCCEADTSCEGGRCHHRACTNPAHLTLLTIGENVARGKHCRKAA